MRWLVTALLFGSVACGGATNEQQNEDTVPSTAGGEEPAPVSREREPEPLDDAEAAEAQSQALRTHAMASQLYRACADAGDTAECMRAQSLYGIAADTWAVLVRGRPGDNAAPEWRFMHGQALFRTGRFEAAADTLDEHLTAGVAPEWRTLAVATLVAAAEHVLEDAVQRGDVQARTEAPAPAGQPPEVTALEVPAPLARLQRARLRYLELVDAALDVEGDRRRHRLDHGLTLHLYGDWDGASAQLQVVVDEGCAGDSAWEGARRAWLTLRQMAVARGRLDALAVLGEQLSEQSCTFGAPAADCTADAEHPLCLARVDAVRIQQAGGTRFLQRAEQSRGEERQRWATRAGEAFLATLEAEERPSVLERALALSRAAAAFAMAEDAEKLAAVDGRILALRLDDFEGGDREFAVQELAHALTRRMEVAQAAGDHRAVTRLAPRITAEALATADLAVERERARALLAQAEVALGRHRQAAEAYEALAAATTDEGVRRDATLAAALQQNEAGGCRRASAGLRSFATTYRGQRGARDGVVRVLWELAQCDRRRAQAYHTALEAVVQGAAATPGPLGTDNRARAAEAAFTLADRDFADVTRIRIRLPRGDNVEDLEAALQAAMREPAADVVALVAAYAAVERFNSPEWSVAAASRAAQAYGALIDGIAGAEWETPNNIRQALPQLTETAAREIRRGTEARAAEIFESPAGRLRCRGAARFVHAVALAGEGIETVHARTARAGLTALNAEMVERCRQRNPRLFR